MAYCPSLRTTRTTLCLGALAALLGACANPNTSSTSNTTNVLGRAANQPEAASGYQAKPGWASTRFAVAAANPLATEAGYQILRAAGSAVDAAIAVQMVLTLVEPQSSGIGGGAFLLHFDGKDVQAFDGRETAPAGATEKLFTKDDGTLMAFKDAVVGGRSVATPGTLRVLELAHQQHGKLPWRDLFQPAIALAEQGFLISPRLHAVLASEQQLRQDPVAAAYFYQADGQAWPVGHRLRNPALAAVLRQLAEHGPKAFYEGALAQAIVDKVQNHPSNPGSLSLADLAGYRAIERAPLCTDYRVQQRDYRLCGFPPPSSGAIAIGQILGMLQHTEAGQLPLASSAQGPLPSAQWLHLYTEASRLAFADRAQYLGDPDFVVPPAGDWRSLLEPAYLAARSQLIDQTPAGRSMQTAKPGTPLGRQSSYARMADQPEYGTSHISIIDAAGQALALTTTIESQFGAGQMVQGFLLNNEMTDFSFAAADANGRPTANRVQPGKRPRSSMSPTLVFERDSGQLLMSGGSPGGAVIIHFTAKLLYGTLNWGLNAQQAINLPNFGSLGGPTLLEENRFPQATVNSLRARGHMVREQALTSGLQAIQKTPNGFFGGADPRREGLVMGD